MSKQDLAVLVITWLILFLCSALFWCLVLH